MENSNILFRINEHGLQVTKSFRLIFFISCIAMTYLCVANDMTALSFFASIGLIISVVIWAYVIFKKDLAEKLFSGISKKNFIIFGILSVYIYFEYFFNMLGSIISNKSEYVKLVGEYTNIDQSLFDVILSIYAVLICIFMILSTLAICGFLYTFWRKFSEIARFFYSKTDKIEIYFVAAAWLIFSVLIVIIYSKTAIFYRLYNNMIGLPVMYDFIYTTDSPMEMKENIYFMVNADSNHLRHPLFGLFSLPFALPCMILSRILFFIPNAYALLIAIMQAFFILISDVLIIRMLKLSGVVKLTALIAYTTTYSALLHYAAIGKYVFSTFWILLFIYLITEKREEREDCFYPASSATITSLALFPFIKEFKGFKDFFIEGIKFVKNFLLLYLLFIRVEKSLGLGNQVSAISLFSGAKITFDQHIYQFFNFVKSIFIWPVSEKTVCWWHIVSYQLAEVTSVDVMGVILFCLAIAGFIVNRKNKFAQICIYWTAFSVFVLMIFGWGTQENGLIIYTLYFGWSYFALIVMLAEKLLSKLKYAGAALYSVLSVIMTVFNTYHLYDMFQFCFDYYPIENGLM